MYIYRRNAPVAFIFTRVLRNRNAVCIYGARTFRVRNAGSKSKQTYLGKIAAASGAVTLNRKCVEWLASHGLGPGDLAEAVRKGAGKRGIPVAPPETWSPDVSSGLQADASRDPAENPVPEVRTAASEAEISAEEAEPPPADDEPPAAEEPAPVPRRDASQVAREPAGGGPAHGTPPERKDSPHPGTGADADPEPGPASWTGPAAEHAGGPGPGTARYGHIHLLSHLSSETGLTDLLKSEFPDSWNGLLALAFSAVCTDGSPLGFGLPAAGRLLPSGGEAGPPDTGGLLSRMSRAEVTGGLAKWRGRLDETDLQAFSPPPPPWPAGAETDLAAMRVCTLFGARSGLPADLFLLHGDRDSAPMFAEAARRAAKGDSGGMVLRGGESLGSRENVLLLTEREQDLGFSLALPETCPAFRGIIMEVLTGAADDQSILASPKGQLIGFSVRTELWGKELYACVFLDRDAKSRAEDTVLFNAMEMLEIARRDPERCAEDLCFQGALLFGEPGTDRRPVPELRPNLIQELTFERGWSIELSDRRTGLRDALALRSRAELSARAFGAAGAGGRGGNGVWGEILVAFAALALLSRLHSGMDEAGLFGDYTAGQLLSELSLISADTGSAMTSEAPESEIAGLFARFDCPPPGDAGG
ncbi:MAG: hypothetical protein LBQ79_14050 [Deltaproteobacteria bacterium]|jgi:hypothetical protein|nr:hypothetical protein [Deltaproteobacteria bacterium]